VRTTRVAWGMSPYAGGVGESVSVHARGGKGVPAFSEGYAGGALVVPSSGPKGRRVCPDPVRRCCERLTAQGGVRA